MARKSFKAGALSAPLPPVIVTVSDGERTNALTIAWTGILATHPPRTYISVRPSSHSYEIFKRGGEFVINLPSADMAKTVDYVGIYTGKKVDKIEKCGLSLVESEVVSVPTLADCKVALECRVAEILPMGTHDVFIADILSVSADESIIDENGKIRFDRANLLAYAHGEYYALGEKLGEFGYSTKKPGKPEKETKISKAAQDSVKAAVDKEVEDARERTPRLSGAGAKHRGKRGTVGRRGAKSKSGSGTAETSRKAKPSSGIDKASVEADDSGKPTPFYVGAPGYKKRRGGRK